ncbi:MAG: hypothetical protein ACFCU1_12055 [Sumerlaeia bacterium]
MADKTPEKNDYHKLFGESEEESRKPYNTPPPIKDVRNKAKALYGTEDESVELDVAAGPISSTTNPTQNPSSRVSRRDREAAVTEEEKELYHDIFGSEADIETVDPDGRESPGNWQSTTVPTKKGLILQGEEQADLIYSKTEIPRGEKVLASATSSVALDWRNAKRVSAFLLIKRIPIWIRLMLLITVLSFGGKYLYDLRFEFVDLDGNDLEVNLIDYAYERMRMPSYQLELQTAPRELRPLVITEGRMRELYEVGIRYINTTSRFPKNVEELETSGFNVALISSDGWRNELLLEPDGDELKVRSPGEDSKPNTRDDFTFSIEGFVSVASQFQKDDGTE